jgi:hypothetical protein
VKKTYHEKITKEAMANLVGNRALEVVVTANIGQDALRFQIGHDHFHYDSNAFARGDAYVESQHALIKSALSQDEPQAAWQAFGRLSHAAQDFYAHSNYVALFRQTAPVRFITLHKFITFILDKTRSRGFPFNHEHRWTRAAALQICIFSSGEADTNRV